MLRLLLRLLLIASLATNAVAAPNASRVHAHGDHPDHATPASTMQSGHEHGAQADAHAHHHGMSNSVDGDAADDDASCCSDGACSCGCIVPPALPLPTLAIASTSWSSAPSRAIPVLPLIRRSTPPFRPPAA
jgi:hypothetical protein